MGGGGDRRRMAAAASPGGTVMRALLAVARLDLSLWRRSPWALVSALVPPIGMAVLLAMLTLSVGRQPVALVIEGQGPEAQSMARIIESDTEAYALTVTDSGTTAGMLENQTAAAVIVVPAGFDQAVTTHQATLDLTLNNVDVDFADDIRRTVARSVAEFDAPQLGIQGEIAGPSRGVLLPNTYRVAIAEQPLRDTNVDFLRYQVLPALVLLVLSVGLMGTALLSARDVEQGTARAMVLSPQPAWRLVAGRFVGGVAASLVVLLPVLGIATVLGVVAPPAGHWPALLAVFIATALAAAGLGAALGAWLRRARVVAMAASVVATYLFFLGGGFTTIAFLPDWLRAISNAVPIRYAIDGMRQCLFYADLRGVAMDLVVLGATAVAAVLIGSLMVRRAWAS
jgi:ABC-2 type transport system permease protein